VSTWLDKTAAAVSSRKPKPDVVKSPLKPPVSAKKQMSIMAFVKKKKDEALATRIMTGFADSPGKFFYIDFLHLVIF
jgi:hypothetical protein